MVKGKIHWKQQTEVPGSYRQHAYNDVHDFTVPFTLSAADNRSDAELRSAFSNAIAARSSSRLFGTSYSLVNLDRSKGIATVRASMYIGN